MPKRYGLRAVVLGYLLLVVGFVANELVRPVNARHHIPAPREETVDVERQQPESA